MYQKHTRWMVGAAALLAAFYVIHLFWPDGLITVNFREAPLSKVIASISRQGRVTIITNVAPETLVTLQMTKAPLLEVLETLAVRVEGDLRAVYAGAPAKSQAREILEEFRSPKMPDSLAISWFPGMGGGLSASTVPDPRIVAVRFEAGEKSDLQSALQQIAAKSGVMTAVPKEWNPAATPPKSPAAASEIVSSVVKAAGGATAEAFLIWSRGGSQDGMARGQDGGGRPPGEGGGPGGGAGGDGPRPGRDGMNPEWMAQRAEAMIAQLPPEERKVAQADYDAMRKLWEEVRALPEDQRREKMQEIFNRPEVQDRMAEREAARDNRMSPAQREKRMQRYVERKTQMKAAQQNQAPK